jgi:predicted transcriptional regulator
VFIFLLLLCSTPPLRPLRVTLASCVNLLEQDHQSQLPLISKHEKMGGAASSKHTSDPRSETRESIQERIDKNKKYPLTLSDLKNIINISK